MASKVVRLIANPYILDHEGRPAGAVLMIEQYNDKPNHPDPSQHWVPRRHVGAVVSAKQTKAPTKLGVHTANDAEHDRTWTFSPSPVSVDVSSNDIFLYYRGLVMNGDLIAFDLASWTLLGGTAKTFRKPLELLAEKKAAAIATHAANHGHESVPDATRKHWSDVLPTLEPSEDVPAELHEGN